MTTLSSQNTFDTVDPGVSYEWIQSLPEELKDAALYKFCKLVETHTTLVESFTLNQVLYRTISGNTFTESAESIASRTGCDRKTILKGLHQAVEQNILEENKRPGTSNEYSFKPVEEWLSEPLRERLSPRLGNPPMAHPRHASLSVLDSPVVHIKDIRNNKIVEFPKIQNTESAENEVQQLQNLEVVHETDDHKMDANTVVLSLKDLEEQQQQACSVPIVDTPTNPSPWKYVGQGVGRVYIPPELDADTGKKIESIHEETKEPRQIIIKRAVDLLHNHLNRIPNYIDQKPKILPTRVGAVSQCGLGVSPSGATGEPFRVVSLPKIEELGQERVALGDEEAGGERTNCQLTFPSPAPEASPASPALKSSKGIPELVYIALQQAGIDLGLGTAERLWTKYSDKFVDAIAYTKAQDEAGKIKQSREGFFRKALEEGWNLKLPTAQESKAAPHKQQQFSLSKLTEQQQEWYSWACNTGVCDGRPIEHLAQAWNGEPGVFVYMPAPNPMVHPWVIRPISIAMREFPMV